MLLLNCCAGHHNVPVSDTNHKRETRLASFLQDGNSVFDRHNDYFDVI